MLRSNWILCFCLSLMSMSLIADMKNFVVVIPSYNNKDWCEQNLHSVLSQAYPHFRVIYTDDCSPDGTGNLVEKYLEDYDIDHRVSLVKNESRRGALHNLYTMINMCDDDDIVVTLDGDDWFPDENVLTRLNDVYSSDEVWLTYGQFKMHPSGANGWAVAMPDYIVNNNAFRDFHHLPTHLRTFYAWLFKKIKLEDLLYQGSFYPMTWDMVMMFPMIEMAGEKHRFIPDVMYVYNEANSISDHYVSRQLQAHLAQVVKQKKRYKRLTEKPDNVTKDLLLADAVVFARNPKSLSLFLESLKTYVKGIDQVFVMFQPMSSVEGNEYKKVKNLYPEVKFCLIKEHRSNFGELLLNIYNKVKNDYILFSKSDARFKKPVSMHDCITDLQKTESYAFYFKLNVQDGIRSYPNLTPVECKKDVYAWNFAFARDKWSLANSLDLVLHKKANTLAQALQNHYDFTPNGLELVWANEGNLDRLGLCFNESCIEVVVA